MLSSDKYCAILSIHVRWSVCTYLDSGNKCQPRRYPPLHSLLNDALETYAQNGGPFHKKGEFFTKPGGTHVFRHGTGFHCVKQKNGSDMEAYYALHHLKGIVRDCEKAKIPSGLAEYTKQADELTDADYRQDWQRIRLQLTNILLEDVIHSAGCYHVPRGRMY